MASFSAWFNISSTAAPCLLPTVPVFSLRLPDPPPEDEDEDEDEEDEGVARVDEEGVTDPEGIDAPADLSLRPSFLLLIESLLDIVGRCDSGSRLKPRAIPPWRRVTLKRLLTSSLMMTEEPRALSNSLMITPLGMPVACRRAFGLS